MSWDQRREYRRSLGIEKTCPRTPPQGVKEERSCKVLGEVWPPMCGKSQRGAIAVMKMKRKVDFGERTICVKYNSIKQIKTFLSPKHSPKVSHTVSLGFPPVGQAGKVWRLTPAQRIY